MRPGYTVRPSGPVPARLAGDPRPFAATIFGVPSPAGAGQEGRAEVPDHTRCPAQTCCGLLFGRFWLWAIQTCTILPSLLLHCLGIPALQHRASDWRFRLGTSSIGRCCRRTFDPLLPKWEFQVSLRIGWAETLAIRMLSHPQSLSRQSCWRLVGVGGGGWGLRGRSSLFGRTRRQANAACTPGKRSCCDSFRTSGILSMRLDACVLIQRSAIQKRTSCVRAFRCSVHSVAIGHDALFFPQAPAPSLLPSIFLGTPRLLVFAGWWHVGLRGC